MASTLNYVSVKAGDKVVIKQESWNWAQKLFPREFREASSPVCTVVRAEEYGYLLEIPNHNYLIFHQNALEHYNEK